MIRPEKPTCLDDLEKLVESIVRTGRPAAVNLPVLNREDAALRALALLGICWGRDESMLEAIIGDAELVEPAKDVKYAIKQDDGSYVFTNHFDRLKSSIYYQLCD